MRAKTQMMEVKGSSQEGPQGTKGWAPAPPKQISAMSYPLADSLQSRAVKDKGQEGDHPTAPKDCGFLFLPGTVPPNTIKLISSPNL